MADFVDLDIFGKETPDGDLLELQSDEALNNNIKAYLLSEQGTYLFEPEAGGLLDSYAFKLLTRETADIAQFDIRTDLEETFQGLITNVNVRVVPDKRTRTFKFQVSYRSLLSGDKSALELFVENVSDREIKPRIEVPYVEENLLSIAQKIANFSDFEGEKLKLKDGVYVYGTFVFTNLTEADPEFDNIKEVLNQS